MKLFVAVFSVCFFAMAPLAKGEVTEWHDPVLDLDFKYIGVMPYGTIQGLIAPRACANLGPGWELPDRNLMLQGEPVGNALVSRVFAAPGFVDNLRVDMNSLRGYLMWYKRDGEVGRCRAFYRAQGSLHITTQYFQACARPSLPVICVKRPF